VGAASASEDAGGVALVSEFVDLRSLAREKAPALPPEALQEALLVHALPTWAGRMKNEHGSARVFRHLAEQLDRAELDGAACREFAEEERRHGVLCAAVLEALGGQAVFVEEPCDYPMHEDASPLEAVARNVLSICCLSETVAVALIGAERLAMTPGPLRDLLESILADEIGHARFGWRLLHEIAPRLSPRERARVDRYLALAFAGLEQHQLAHISDASSPGGLAAELGVCDGRDMRALFYRTAEEVIVPRLEDLGFAARAAWDARHITAYASSSASSSGPGRSAPGS
jgi:rubrerythrin